MSKKDTDDVLDFINSLPDSKSNTPKPKSKISGSNDDFLEFLDELSAHEKTSKPVGSSKGKFEPKKKLDGTTTPQKKSDSYTQGNNEENSIPVLAQEVPNAVGAVPKSLESEKNVSESPSKVSQGGVGLSESSEPATGEVSVDPIASISSWWNSEGSSKVSSLWGSITSNAHQLSETTYQIASSTSQQLSHQRHKFLTENSDVAGTEQILHITDKLNSILTTMSEQIKDGLIDKEDELMNILLIYDLNNINYLDSICASKFNKVMGQVEGGIKTTVSNFNHKHGQSTSSKYYDLGMFSGKAIDGEKLCFANLDGSIKDYLKITDLEQSQLSAGESVGHEINKSNVFIAIQPITSGNIDQQSSEEDSQGPAFIEANNANSFSFTMILKDITNNITVLSKSQPFPLRWARWVSGQHDDVDAVFGSNEDEESVDPSEWVKEWIEDGLGLTFAVLAQEYVTRRMGI
ncbi:hypothetical protein JCM33374_g3654 [Metschnikowia sp. JCM 33374]|nr:hypothetical protein JCM33374_g3654 [Metschnikowia sp. JCM 33374]